MRRRGETGDVKREDISCPLLATAYLPTVTYFLLPTSYRVHIFFGVVEFTHALTHATHEFRNFFCPEEQQYNRQNYQNFIKTQSHKIKLKSQKIIENVKPGEHKALPGLQQKRTMDIKL